MYRYYDIIRPRKGKIVAFDTIMMCDNRNFGVYTCDSRVTWNLRSELGGGG